MSLENLPKSMDEGAALNPVVMQELAFEGEALSDEAAMKLVIQDTDFAERFVQSKTLVQEWNAADELYRAYVPAENWDNSKNARSHIPMPVVLEAIESLLPQAHMAFFSDTKPFLLDAKGRTSPAAARAMGNLLCWGKDASNLEEEIRKCLKSSFQYGICVGKYGWCVEKHKKRTYRRGETGIEMVDVEHEISKPTFEYVDLRNVLVDPHTSSHDIRTSRYVVFQKYIDANELDELRKGQDYKNVPTRAELKAALVMSGEPTKDSLLGNKYYTWRENQAQLPTEQASIDPLKQPLELLEYWTDDRVITVLQRKFVIRNEENPLGVKPFVSCAFIDVLNSFYGYGVSKLLSGEQAFQTGVLNKWVDSLSLRMNPVWQRKKGINSMSQNITIGPGRVINDDGELIPLEMPDLSETALAAIGSSESRAARRVGANFGPEMPTQAMRTAEGVQAFTAGVQVRLQYFIENFADMVFLPTLEAFLQMFKDNMEPEEINAILSEQDGKAYQGEILDVYNGQYKVDVLPSVKIAGRRAMAQMLIPVMQMLGQPAVGESFQVQGKKFDWVEFFNQIFDVTGWPGGSLIVDMTDEDQKRAMADSAAAKAQAAQAQMQMQHQNALQLQDAKADGQAGVAVVRSILKTHEPQAVSAQPLAKQPTGGGRE